MKGLIVAVFMLLAVSVQAQEVTTGTVAADEQPGRECDCD